MTDYVMFTIYGKPVGKERPRMVNGHVYTPKKTKRYEKDIQNAYLQTTDKRPLFNGWAEVEINYSTGDKRRCDCDNVLKSVLDALTGFAYDDDARVERCVVQREYSEDPYTIVRVEWRKP